MVLFRHLWVLPFPLEDCSVPGNFVITLINISNVLATIKLFECLWDLISYHDVFVYLKVCRHSHLCLMVNIFRSSFRVIQTIARTWVLDAIWTRRIPAEIYWKIGGSHCRNKSKTPRTHWEMRTNIYHWWNNGVGIIYTIDRHNSALKLWQNFIAVK